jgi:NADH-quinone oxidoreductase subunit L
MPEVAAWAIFLLPMASFLLISFFIRPFLSQESPDSPQSQYSRLAGYLTISAVAGSLLLSLWALQVTTNLPGGAIAFEMHPWMTVGPLEIRIGILMDSLTVIMALVVSSVSLAVQVYSQGYMRNSSDATGSHRDARGYARYYAIMSLFTASMLGLVLAGSIIQVFLFWELVGLCSYLLIGFWYHRPSAARAAVKAFVVTRLGDVGFLIAILALYMYQDAFAARGLNPLEVADIHQIASVGLSTTAITWIALGIFTGAIGKSAQFPLHIWLPDAMEGPTPVSALIHAATMVTAGVFLVARFFPVFEAAPDAMTLVAILGGVTAVFAATMGLVMYDIKRVVAYSTISQLGYMVLALGIGAYSVAIFHLFTHAFFKALLFLGSGSVNHATGTFDMRYMGGLRRRQPWTYATFLLAALSLAGIFPLAGFWSKDEILAEAFRRGIQGGDATATIVFFLAIVAVFMTAFYIFRVLFMTFHGDFRGGIEAEEAARGGTVGAAQARDDGHHEASEHGRMHLGESPWVMVGPMVALAMLSVVAGVLGSPPFDVGPISKHWITEFLTAPGHSAEAPVTNAGVAVFSLMVAGAGILTAWLLYGSRKIAPERVTIGPLHRLFSRKYYMDDLAENLIMSRAFYRVGCGVLDWFDRNILDGLVDTVGWLGRNFGRALAQLQTGQLQGYGTAVVVGVGLILMLYLLWG